MPSNTVNRRRRAAPESTVTGGIEGDEVVITVSDRGRGIAPEDREHVLERFVRLDESRSRPGNGLGLSLVAGVMKLHDGRVVLEDNQPGLRVKLSCPGSWPKSRPLSSLSSGISYKARPITLMEAPMSHRTDVARHWEANAETWTKHARAGYDVYRDALNTPAFLSMLPADHRSLPASTSLAAKVPTPGRLPSWGAGCTPSISRPLSFAMPKPTEEDNPLGIIYQVGDGMDLPYASAIFRFRHILHGAHGHAGPGRVLSEIARVSPKPGGFLQFAILHPCFVPPYRKTLREPDGRVRAIEVGRYFDADRRPSRKLVVFHAFPTRIAAVAPFPVPRFHRSLSQWVASSPGPVLTIEALGEPYADAALAASRAGRGGYSVAQMFLHFRARKPLNGG